MRPHEEAKLLSSEELDVQFYAHQWGNMAQSHAAQLALRAHIAALEADNAARVSAFCNYVDMHGVEHDLGCPEDDTCECPLIVALNAAFRDDSPGATLLSEHAKELENGKAERDRLRDGLMEEARWGAVGRAAALALRPFSKSDAELLDVVLQRALVRARNEGLERAARRLVTGTCGAPTCDHVVCVNLRLEALAIDAMKETET